MLFQAKTALLGNGVQNLAAAVALAPFAFGFGWLLLGERAAPADLIGIIPVAAR